MSKYPEFLQKSLTLLGRQENGPFLMIIAALVAVIFNCADGYLGALLMGRPKFTQ